MEPSKTIIESIKKRDILLKYITFFYYIGNSLHNNMKFLRKGYEIRSAETLKVDLEFLFGAT